MQNIRLQCITMNFLEFDKTDEYSITMNGAQRNQKMEKKNCEIY